MAVTNETLDLGMCY